MFNRLDKKSLNSAPFFFNFTQCQNTATFHVAGSQGCWLAREFRRKKWQAQNLDWKKKLSNVLKSCRLKICKQNNNFLGRSRFGSCKYFSSLLRPLKRFFDEIALCFDRDKTKERCQNTSNIARRILRSSKFNRRIFPYHTRRPHTSISFFQCPSLFPIFEWENILKVSAHSRDFCASLSLSADAHTSSF